jgi:hypothetical protein
MSGPTIRNRRRTTARVRVVAADAYGGPRVRRFGYRSLAEPLQEALARRRVAAQLTSALCERPAATVVCPIGHTCAAVVRGGA